MCATGSASVAPESHASQHPNLTLRLRADLCILAELFALLATERAERR
jgi:hypothetical protein